jgi:transporter family protein
MENALNATSLIIGFGVLKLPVSIVAPLTNSNALVAVLVGSIAFAEWRQVSIPTVIVGPS